jgi:hypothetical protein
MMWGGPLTGQLLARRKARHEPSAARWPRPGGAWAARGRQMTGTIPVNALDDRPSPLRPQDRDFSQLRDLYLGDDLTYFFVAEW